ncbi:hypothetical protein Daus18300_010473 [Diaporthe australafricana]|uniref:Uncharacterized protein n=1 Tax=Diaporthe australafricana TaxID=127596 RepID=A0ABR3WA99_9PEZI
MAGRYPAHEGLQIAQQDHAPEVYRYHEAAPEIAPQGYASSEKPVLHQEAHLLPASKPRRWCGLSKRTALIVAAVVALVVIGAVVGGIAGALLARNSSSNASSASSASSATPSASSAADAAVTSAAITTSSASSTSTASTIPSTTSTSTAASTSSAFPTPANNILPLNCPAINNTQYTTEGASFFVYCLMDFKSGSGNIAQSLQPGINDCIGSCVTYNSENTDTEKPCQGLTFGANLTR